MKNEKFFLIKIVEYVYLNDSLILLLYRRRISGTWGTRDLAVEIWFGNRK